MIAIDTNIIVRILAGDDPEQSPRARALVDANQVFVSTTVFLEAEWVLRGVYRMSSTVVVAKLRAFAGLPGVTLEDPARVMQALDWCDHGLGFADALHLASAVGCDGFFTFDRGLAKLAPVGVVVRAP